MPKDLARLLDGMDGWKAAFLDALSARTPERLAFRPAGTAWCTLDVVQHLVLVEEAVLGYARKKLLGPPQPVSLVDRTKLGLLVLVLRSPIRFRAPALQVVPKETLPLAELGDRWEIARRGIRELVVALPPGRRATLLFRHPLSGPLDAFGTLTFLHEHARHHDAQIRRIGRAPGAPA